MTLLTQYINSSLQQKVNYGHMNMYVEKNYFKL